MCGDNLGRVYLAGGRHGTACAGRSISGGGGGGAAYGRVWGTRAPSQWRQRRWAASGPTPTLFLNGVGAGGRPRHGRPPPQRPTRFLNERRHEGNYPCRMLARSGSSSKCCHPSVLTVPYMVISNSSHSHQRLNSRIMHAFQRIMHAFHAFHSRRIHAAPRFTA